MAKFSEINRPLSLIDTYRGEAKLLRAKRNRALRHHLTNEDRANLRVLDGLDPGLITFIASDNRARFCFARNLSRGFRRVWRSANDLQVLHVTIINENFETSDERTEIRLAELTKQARHILDATGGSWIGGVDFAVFANRTYPAGGRVISPHVHATVWGCDILQHAQHVADGYNKRLHTGVAGVEAVKVQLVRATWPDIERVLTYPYRPPARTKTVYYNPRTGLTNIHESEKADRYVRYLRMMQLLSLIEQDRLCFAGGQGTVIRRQALQEAHTMLEQRTSATNRASQMEWIEDFWAELLPRCELRRFAAPQITLR
ncbi:hypothetical protein [Sphingomonas mucosissima]|uniref:Replication protein n=1 Tax=Sphingomonas mucosissima TaxID=370959 RepID=A0A245ZQJ7_9SPHN|nr:hypothetical protein [Sphingomonas mucosissima]OWK32022.1 hypothetical protein SPMU_03430 [Sphingomonas mucosissima]